MPDFKSKERFSNRADVYVKHRPSYPQALVNSLVQKLPVGSLSSSIVADVGSGTGIFSRLLLENGFTVYGVEPNAPMRQRAEGLLSSYPNFHSIKGEATNTMLEDHSVDVVAAAQAFHWFATTDAVKEFARILKKPGLVVLIWNDRRTDVDEFHADYESLLVRYCLNYVEINHRNITAQMIQALFAGWQLSVEHFPNDQLLDFNGLKGRLESSSYCPHPDHPNYRPLMDHLHELFKKHHGDGDFRLQQDCVAYYLVRTGIPKVN
jgi:SAM-dependent methyltransferase